MVKPKIHFFKKLYPLPHTHKILPSYVKIPWDARPHPKKNRFITLTKKLIQILDPMIASYLNPILTYHPNLLIENVTWEAIQRYPYSQLPARPCLCLKNRYLMSTPLPKIIRRRQSRRARTYDRRSPSRRPGDHLTPMFPPNPRVPLSRSPLNSIDGYWRLPERTPTHRLTRPITDVATNPGKRYPLTYHCRCLPKPSQRYVTNVPRHVDSRRTA